MRRSESRSLSSRPRPTAPHRTAPHRSESVTAPHRSESVTASAVCLFVCVFVCLPQTVYRFSDCASATECTSLRFAANATRHPGFVNCRSAPHRRGIQCQVETPLDSSSAPQILTRPFSLSGMLRVATHGGQRGLARAVRPESHGCAAVE